ncbi:MAG: hypothetical protein LJE68_05935, partial [Rhodobacter sp.]|nr:hypothetical protein [Rhodobacter sp.]
GTDNKFAAELASLMNQYGADGWEYQCTDTLPCEERQGLTGRVTTFQNMLIFRKNLDQTAQSGTVLSPAPASRDPMLAVPTFRSTAQTSGAIPALSARSDVPEGRAPELGAAKSDMAVQ